MQRIGVIMAGGSGERFWPVSRRLRPKQLLRLTSPDETMLQEAVSRLAPIIPPDHVYAVTGEHLVAPIRAGSTGLPDANVIAEPAKRNTSGALAYAAAHALARYGGDGSDITMAVVTADHRIGDPDRFRAVIGRAMDAAESHGALVTLGVKPSRAETGYGYMQRGASLESRDGVPLYEVRAFFEKPGAEAAHTFANSGEHYWNSGMFFWTIAVFLRELDTVRPQLAEAVRAMAKAIGDGKNEEVHAIFNALEDISIDYALMEQAERVLMAPADFPWDDVGAWTALDRTKPKDAEGNVTVGDPVLVGARNCIVYNDSSADKMAVAVVGAEDLIVAVTEDAILVMPKDQTQDIRAVVRKLRERGASQL